MRFLSALCAGITVFLVVAGRGGHLDALRLPGRRHHRLSRRTWLAQAGANVSPSQFLFVSAMLGVAVLLLCWALAGSAVIGLVPALVAAYLPKTWYAHHRRARLNGVVAAWPDGILHLLAALRAGSGSVHAALVDLAASGPEPLQEAFVHYEAWARVGTPITALHRIREQLADPISDKAIAVLIEASKRGTEVALTILARQAEDIRTDERVTMAIRDAQREPQITGAAAFALPWTALVMGCATSPNFREFYATGGGHTIILVAALVSLVGLAMIRYLGREAPEPRVLGEEP